MRLATITRALELTGAGLVDGGAVTVLADMRGESPDKGARRPPTGAGRVEQMLGETRTRDGAR